MNRHHLKPEVDILMGKLKKLSSQDRMVLGLYFYERLTVDEISALLGWSGAEIEKMLKKILPEIVINPLEMNHSEYSSLEMF